MLIIGDLLPHGTGIVCLSDWWKSLLKEWLFPNESSRGWDDWQKLSSFSNAGEGQSPFVLGVPPFSGAPDFRRNEKGWGWGVEDGGGGGKRDIFSCIGIMAGVETLKPKHFTPSSVWWVTLMVYSTWRDNTNILREHLNTSRRLVVWLRHWGWGVKGNCQSIFDCCVLLKTIIYYCFSKYVFIHFCSNGELPLVL